VIRQRAFFKQRIIGRIGSGHGGDLRAQNENASDEGMKSSHKGLLTYQKTSNSQTFDIQRFNSDWKSDATERVPPVISATGIDRRYRRILMPFEFLNDSANCLGYAVAAIRTLLLFFGAEIDRGFRKAGQFLIGAAFFLQRSVQ